MNVTYEYYKDSFGGSLIPENRWISLELKMSARLNQYTFDRMKEDNWPEQAKQHFVKCAIVHISMSGVTERLRKITMDIQYHMI